LKSLHFAAADRRSKFAAGEARGELGMKVLTVAATLLALLVLPAQAQMGGMGKRGGGNGGESKTDAKKPKIDEKAYKDALKRIPEPKEKYDPWSGARPATADQKTDQKTK
jgi:hypothetical protein